MKHIALQDWVDFVRNVAKPEQKKLIRQHLDTGCKACKEEWTKWKQVVEVAGREADYEPSADDLRIVAAQFQQLAPSEPRNAFARVAKLMFDSTLQPAVAGVRAAGSTARQLLYKQGDCYVDMRLEAQAESKRMSLVGQVLDSSRPETYFHNVAVSLLRKDETIARTRTNEVGEFHFEFALEPGLLLSADVPGNGVVVAIPEVKEVHKPGMWL